MFRQVLVTRSTQPENTYGPFAAEILRAEGLMGFRSVDIDTAPLPEIGPGDLVLFTRCFLRNAEMDAVVQAVAAGAAVVFLQPQPSLAERFGLKPVNRVILPGYVKIRDAYPGCGTPIQTHLPIALYETGTDAEGPGWRVIADALDHEWQPSGHPAVVQATVGKGSVTFFFYDLAEAVARIRFGNPDLASYSTVGWRWPHAFDLFEGHVDERLAHLPQADFHGQLLAKVLTDVCTYPLARLWYYEAPEHRTAAVFQSDGDMSEPEQFESLASSLEQRGARGTFYLMRRTKLSEEQVQELRSRGHTFGPHVDPRNYRDTDGPPEEVYFNISKALRGETALFKERFGECSPTLQCHCGPWVGYMHDVPAYIENGYRLLFAFISEPSKTWGAYMCGSGRPMRFFDRDGSLYDCWQQPLITFDDGSVVDWLTKHVDEAFDKFRSMLRSALETTHTGISILSHPVSFCTYSQPFMERCFDQLREDGVPIYNGDEWYEFSKRRAAVSIEQSVGANGALVCSVTGLEGRIPLMVPLGEQKGGTPHAEVDGVATRGEVLQRLGEDYLFLQLEGKVASEAIRIQVGTPV